MTRYDRLAAQIKSKHPNVRIIQRKCGKVSFCLPGRIYISRLQKGSFSTLAHEYVHIQQYHRYGVIGFFLRYFFPQWLAIIPLLIAIAALITMGLQSVAIISGILALICLCPWPSPSRLSIELEAFRTAEARLSYMQAVAAALSGPGYWFCSWSKRKTLGKLL